MNHIIRQGRISIASNFSIRNTKNLISIIPHHYHRHHRHHLNTPTSSAVFSSNSINISSNENSMITSTTISDSPPASSNGSDVQQLTYWHRYASQYNISFRYFSSSNQSTSSGDNKSSLEVTSSCVKVYNYMIMCFKKYIFIYLWFMVCDYYIILI